MYFKKNRILGEDLVPVKCIWFRLQSSLKVVVLLSLICCLLLLQLFVVVLCWSLFCYAVCNFHSIYAIIFMGKKAVCLILIVL